MATTKPMNLVLIVSDTLRRDHLSCYGNPWIHTENIQAFADKALVFDRAYSASFPTVPMRRDIFTGRYTATYTPWAPMTNSETLLQELLQKRGYTTYMVSDEPHILENGYYFDRGFSGYEWIRGQEGDRWKTSPKTPAWRCDPRKIRNPERLQHCHMRARSHWKSEADTFAGRTSSAVTGWLEENHNNGPFYLYVDFFDPHEPWDAPQHYVDMYDPGYKGDVVDYPLYAKWREFLTEKELKHCRALYAAEVTLVDRSVGAIFRKIEDLGLADNTVVMFTTDHGFLLGEHGFIGKSLIQSHLYQGILSYLPLYEEINHVPLMIRAPGCRPGRTDAIVQPPDFMPFLLECAGTKVPACDGKSFRRVLTSHKATHREFAVSFPYLKGSGIPITYVDGRYAAVFFSADVGKDGGAAEDKAVDGVSKGQSPWVEATDMLFDLARDPGQMHNLADKQPTRMESLRKRIVKFLVEAGTDDDMVAQWAAPRRKH